MPDRSRFEAMGGEPKLRAVVADFVGRMYSDPMIGFFFRRVDRERLERREYEFAAEFLGADVAYSGRPLADAHRPHRIMGGQFARRKEILRQVLEAHALPPEVARAWLEHTESLRPLITRDEGSECR